MKFYGWTKERGLGLERKRTCIPVQRMKVTRRTLSWCPLEPRLKYASINFFELCRGYTKNRRQMAISWSSENDRRSRLLPQKIDVKWRCPDLVKMIGRSRLLPQKLAKIWGTTCTTALDPPRV